MVERPLAERRPVGPFMEIDMDEALGDKVQLGVAGTSMPNIRKGPLNVLFVLEDHVATLPKDVKGTLGVKINDKLQEDARIDVKRSGSSSKAPFYEQAIILRLKGDNLPVQDSQIHSVSDSIERHYSNIGVRVRTVIMDTE